MTVMGLRVPFVDAKLQRFTEQIVNALQSSVMQTSSHPLSFPAFDAGITIDGEKLTKTLIKQIVTNDRQAILAHGVTLAWH